MNYYIIRDRVPYILFILMLLKKNDKENVFYDLISGSLLVMFFIEFTRSLVLFFNGLSHNSFYGFDWISIVPVSWGLCVFIILGIVYKNRKPVLEGFFYGFNLVVFGGWLYEIPLFLFRGSNPISFKSMSFLLVNNHVIIPFMIYYFNRKIRISKKTIISFLFVIIGMVLTYYERVNPYHGAFPLVILVRLPTQIFLIMLIKDLMNHAFE